MRIQTTLSVVGPVYNEQQSLLEFHERLVTALETLETSWEVIYVNDGSTDKTAEILRQIQNDDSRIKVLHFSRNFGHQFAITAGLDHASSDACVVMDTDGQDPPEIIERLVAAWREGFEVVYAVRLKREQESLFKKITAATFYRLMRFITDVRIPVDAGDFRLLDRKVVETLRQFRETHRFMRGLTCWVGFRQTQVAYVRKPRLGGQTHYPFWKMVRFAMDAITSFSTVPLRLVFYCGLIYFFVSISVGVWAFYVKYFTTTAVPGWTSLIMIGAIRGGTELIAIGILGEYLGRILDEVKRRPLYIVSEAQGFTAPAQVGSKFSSAPLPH